jgi:hypothetical protein
MAIEDVVARINAIQQLVARAESVGSGTAARPVVTSGSATGTAFGATLDRATVSPGGGATATLSPEETGAVVSGAARSLQSSPADSPVATAVRVAQAEIGVTEDPPGSNNGVRISEYRTATAGSAPGIPWCAYFVSWAARQAGVPIGEEGQGYGAVEQIASWAERTGRMRAPGALPEPGDLILFGGRHVGIVETVSPDGRLTTIEGNHHNAVQRVERTVADATGFVQLGT